jgi:hypothetical protein
MRTSASRCSRRRALYARHGFRHRQRLRRRRPGNAVIDDLARPRRAAATQCAEPRRSLARRTGPGRGQRRRAGAEPGHSRPEEGKRGAAGRRHARQLGAAAGRHCLLHVARARRPGRSGQGPGLGALRHRRMWAARSTCCCRRRASSQESAQGHGGYDSASQRPARHRRCQGGPGRPRADGRRFRGPHWRLQLAQRQGGPHRLRLRRADRAVPLSHRRRPAVARLGAAAGGHRRLVSGLEEGSHPVAPAVVGNTIVHSPRQERHSSRPATTARAPGPRP